jgi:hypothetical protein
MEWAADGGFAVEVEGEDLDVEVIRGPHGAFVRTDGYLESYGASIVVGEAPPLPEMTREQKEAVADAASAFKNEWSTSSLDNLPEDVRKGYVDKYLLAHGVFFADVDSARAFAAGVMGVEVPRLVRALAERAKTIGSLGRISSVVELVKIDGAENAYKAMEAYVDKHSRGARDD